jgi:hypothetical protein
MHSATGNPVCTAATSIIVDAVGSEKLAEIGTFLHPVLADLTVQFALFRILIHPPPSN